MAVLDQRLLGLPCTVTERTRGPVGAWADMVLSGVSGPLRGLSTVGIPERFLSALRHVGVPLAGPEGGLRWGRDVLVAAVPRPQVDGTRLLVPHGEDLLALSSLALKPLRIFISDRLGLRLQAATGIGFYLWERRALLVSCSDLPLGGFLHGPEPGQRHGVDLAPGGHQIIEW